MTTITVFPATPAGGFLAVAGDKESAGPTVGQALDALTEQVPLNGTTVVLIQPMGPDEYFPRVAQERLAELTARRKSGGRWTEADQAEFDGLTDAELRATTARSAAILRAAAVPLAAARRASP